MMKFHRAVNQARYGLKKLRKARRGISPRHPQKERSPAYPLILARET